MSSTLRTTKPKSNATSTKKAIEVTAEKKSVAKNAGKPAIIEGVDVAPTPPRKKAALGSVVFIAAGPGDPELLTVRALRLLKSADKIVADSQAMHIALAYVHEDKVVSTVGEDEIELEPAETAKLVLEFAREAQLVVRLVIGDPIISGRLVPEISVLRRSHANFEIVP